MPVVASSSDIPLSHGRCVDYASLIPYYIDISLIWLMIPSLLSCAALFLLLLFCLRSNCESYDVKKKKKKKKKLLLSEVEIVSRVRLFESCGGFIGLVCV